VGGCEASIVPHCDVTDLSPNSIATRMSTSFFSFGTNDSFISKSFQGLKQ
jgi:hypothetical protein